MAQVFMRFPGGRQKSLTFSYDDGIEQDKRLIALFRKYGMKATFNLNSGLYAPEGFVYPEGAWHRRMSESEVTKLYVGDDIEVAIHGSTHPWLDHMPLNMVTKDLMDDREKLEKQFNTIVRGMAYPFGTYTDETVEAMRCTGIVYARTVQSTHDFNMPGDWMRLPATCHYNDPELMNLGKSYLEKSPWDMRPKMFYVWGHSYEFDQFKNWDMFEEFCKMMSGKEDIWYATNIEIYNYQDDFKRLRFSMDGSVVQNPTGQELWFFLNGKVYSVKAGETKHIEAEQ